MAKSQVRPPRPPRKETPAVTIANQNNQIKYLTDRIVALVKERDDALKANTRLMGEIEEHKACGEALCAEVDKLKGVIAAASSSNQRMLGWQDCAREVFSEMKIST